VFNLLREVEEISNDLDSINVEGDEISDLFTKLTEEINHLNAN